MKFALEHKTLISEHVITGFSVLFPHKSVQALYLHSKSLKSKLWIWEGKKGSRVTHLMLSLTKQSYLLKYSCSFLAFLPHPIFIIRLIMFFSCDAMRETSTFSDGRLAYCTPTLPLKATRKYMEKVFESSRDLPKMQGLEGPRLQREENADIWSHFSPWGYCWSRRCQVRCY